MKAKELIYNLKSNVDTQSKLAGLTDHHIMFMLDKARAVLAGQKLQANLKVDHMVQFIDKAPVAVPNTTLGSIGDKTLVGVDVPPSIAANRVGGILTVGSLDGKEEYTKTDYGSLKLIEHRKYTSKATKWVLIKDTVVIINSTTGTASKVRIRGLFDEPWRVEVLNGTYNLLKPFEFEYPISFKDVKSLYSIAMSGDMSWGDISANAIIEHQNKVEEARQRSLARFRDAQG